MGASREYGQAGSRKVSTRIKGAFVGFLASRCDGGLAKVN